MKSLKQRAVTLGVAVAAAFLITLVLPPRAAGVSGDTASLQAEILRIAAPVGGEVGLAAWRLDGDGPRILVNADKPFPMASTFKVAVAGALLAKIDAGTLTLDRMIPVDRNSTSSRT